MRGGTVTSNGCAAIHRKSLSTMKSQTKLRNRGQMLMYTNAHAARNMCTMLPAS